MAVIPRYVSKESLTRESGSGYMKPETYGVQQDPATAAKTSIGAAMQDISQTILTVNEKIKKVKNANAESQANILSTTDFAAYEDEFNRNPDVNHSLDDIDNKISATKNKATKLFDDPIAREEYLRNYELKALIFKQGLKTQQAKRIVDLGRANTLKEIDLEASAYINAITPEDRVNSRVRMEAIMNKAVSMQLFTEERGYNELNSIIKSADDAAKDVEGLKRRREKEMAELQKRAITERQRELIKMRINREAPLEELIKMATRDMNEGRIEEKWAEAYINASKTPKSIGAKTKSAKFVGFVNDMLYNKVKPEDVEIALMEANTAGALADEDFDLLYTFNQQVNQGKDFELVPDINAMKAAKTVGLVKSLQFWGDENAGARDESKGRMFKNYMDKIRQGVQPEIAIEESIKEEVLKLYPQAKTAPEEGIDIIDLNGVIKHITPNGELTIKEGK